MGENLTKEIAYKEFQKFFQSTPFVLFGTGMSCAVDKQFGMKSLEQKLINKLNNENLQPEQQKEWDKVLLALNNGSDFESAMNNATNNNLIKRIVTLTSDYVSSLDYKYSQNILNGEKNWPATPLFKKLVDKLPGSDKKLHVATPNYDMLAEYAFGKADIPYINGFHGGVIRKLDWEQSRRSITYGEKTLRGKKTGFITREHKHVRLYKVHGSLNWFLINDKLIENNSWLHTKTPKDAERLIITPGMSKYEKLHQFRSELLGNFDNAIEKHNFFLFLGFGFNDKQLNTRTILDKLKNQKCNGLIITKETNVRINALLAEAENLWLIYQKDNGTEIKNKKYTNSLFLKNEELWQVDIFTKKILGE